MLRVSVKMVTRLIEAGKLAASNVGLGLSKPRYRIKRTSVEEFLREQQVSQSFENSLERVPRRRQNFPGVVDQF